MKSACLAILLLSACPAVAQTTSQPASSTQADPATQAPCKDPKRPEYRQFDFWVGEWDVFDNKSDRPVGTSSIQLILKDCVIYENWTGARGFEGKSFNKYNPWLKQWEQYWVDSGVDRMFFTGHLVDGEMRFQTDGFTEQGKPLHRKLTFYNRPDGTVRQFSEASTDGKKTYTVEYDFVYKRRKR
ncbi:MAG TPA: hypothetical protein VD837_11990 [Terriglobales bacterium]|nr:hypothetical protein [Terriglobales bacterium]